MKFYDCSTAPSPRRVRIFAAEKGINLPTVQVDLRNGEQFSDAFRAINPDCTVPALVLDDGTVIADAVAICGYLEELHPDPPLLPADPVERARARLLVHRFDANLGDDYYAYRRGDANDLAGSLERLEVGQSLYADVAYVPWVIRVRDMLGVSLPPAISSWLGELELRASVAAEVDVVRALR